MKRLYTKRWFGPRRYIHSVGIRVGGWACTVNMHAAGLLFNPGAWWIGVHYSPGNKRFCVNLLPMLTIWYILPGGTEP